jgi:hypothetical protein
MKDQFQSSEALKVRFPPFVNKTNGDEILGTDTCTVTYKKPDNSTGSLSATWDSDIQLWKLDIASGSYMQGEWLFKAVSSDTNGRTQRKSLQWGDYVSNLDALVSSRLATSGYAAPDNSGIADIKAKTNNLPSNPASQTNLDAAVSSRLAASAYTAPANADIVIIRKMIANGWKVQGTQLIVYDDNGTDIYKVYDLKDDSGNPSSTRIFQRVPL